MATVTLNRLEKTYPDKHGVPQKVVHGIDLEIRDGEFMVLVGPSGCGKSTTLRMIAGLEEISGGTVSIDGREVNQVLPKDRDIAMVFQNYALYPHMSVYENMAFGLKLRKFSKSEIDTRVREAAALLGLQELLDRRPKALSGGQRQRVAVGRAIVRKPKVFLFDEPLSNLDAKMRVSMRAEISRLHERIGATMIYVTHDQVEAMTMGDRICVMNQGRIMQVAEPLTLYQQPANLFVAGFIGSPAMNFLRGTAVREADGVYFLEEKGPGKIPLNERLSSIARGHLNRPLTLGVRPEAISPAPAGSPPHLSATIELVEPLGAETYLYLNTGSHALVARTLSGTRAAPHEAFDACLDLAHAQLFDPVSEGVLSTPHP